MGEASAVNRTLYTATALPVPADGPLPSGRGCRTRLPPLDGRRSAGRGRGARLDHRRRRPGASTSTPRAAPSWSASVTAAPRSPRPWPSRRAVSRSRTAAPSPPSRSRPTRPRSAPPPGRRPVPVPGLRRLRGHRDRPQDRPGVSPRRRRARPGRGDRALGELPRQHPGRARPVRPPAAPPAVRAVARAVRARVRGLPVRRRPPGRDGPRRPRGARRRAGAGHRRGGGGARRGLRRRARRRGDAGRRGPAGRLLAADRRGLPPARRAADRRRGHDRLRADRALVRVRPLGPATGPARRGQGRHVGLLAVRVRRRVRRDPCRGHRRAGRLRPRVHVLAQRRSARPWPARCCGRSRPSGWSRRARPRATGCGRCSRARWASTRRSARSAASG